ncbi:ABC transporter substrate-binding protein [Pseudobacteriovorax antillogorgiicola]|uniref:Carbohydrate ABC transporter substrate-binding protein, CUT1 family n=1 Tax=Pseudobacteriovorax antillogorgiicola TaxID=1513793 RepID=A0A1Y6BBV8_9BACT|nr:extracellular solute-binding protein [Pseudobacteriovorax antillogorgiicola]TCS57352.1 carbohydrate ABC transporter substrate-binding protein (CUT1 family) [Pseudobacteriovorax antillogorgiicola]SMF02101.1 carbohydrate ABC transporter substrate-binding protein, CUT1 family [Pseudobacteriovorax antillogorgiicola]
MKRVIKLLALVSSLGFGVEKPTSIRFDAFPDFDSHLKNVLPGYHKIQDGIKVDFLMNNHGDHHTKLTNNLATGSGAGDVVAVDINRLGAFIDAGGFVNLDQAPYNAQSLKQYFPAYAWSQGKGSDGKQYAIPTDLGPGVMYYRRDHLKATSKSIEAVNKDWDSFLAWGEELKKRKVALIADASDIALLMVYSGGKPGEGIFFDSQGKSLLTSSRFVEAVNLAKKIRQKGLDLNITSWTNEWYEALRTGKVGTQLSGAWLLGHLQNWIAPKSAGMWGVAHLPNGIYGSWGGSFLCITKQSKHPNEAWQFIKFMTTPETQISGLQKIAAFPARTDTYSNEIFKEPIDYLAGQKARLLFAEIAKNVTPIKPFRGDAIARTIFLNALEEAVDQNQDTTSVLKSASRMLERRTRRF